MNFLQITASLVALFRAGNAHIRRTVERPKQPHSRRWTSRTVCQLLVSLVCWSSESVLAQVLADKVEIDGRQVERQKFTLNCIYKARGYDTKGGEWFDTQAKWTLHVINTKELTSKAVNEVPARVYGWYNWSSNTWQKFHYVDENYFSLLSFGSSSNVLHTAVTEGGVHITNPVQVARNSLETLNSPWCHDSSGTIACKEKQLIFDERKPCTLRSYEAPPIGLGF